MNSLGAEDYIKEMLKDYNDYFSNVSMIIYVYNYWAKIYSSQ